MFISKSKEVDTPRPHLTVLGSGIYLISLEFRLVLGCVGLTVMMEPSHVC